MHTLSVTLKMFWRSEDILDHPYVSKGLIMIFKLPSPAWVWLQLMRVNVMIYVWFRVRIMANC